MSCCLHFLPVCLVGRFVRSECFRAAKSTELVPRRRKAERREERGERDAEKLVLYCLFQFFSLPLFLLAQFIRFLSSQLASPLLPPRELFSVVTSWCDEMHPFLLNLPHFLLPFGFRWLIKGAKVGMRWAEQVFFFLLFFFAASRPAAPAEARSRSGMTLCCNTFAARELEIATLGESADLHLFS